MMDACQVQHLWHYFCLLFVWTLLDGSSEVPREFWIKATLAAVSAPDTGVKVGTQVRAFQRYGIKTPDINEDTPNNGWISTMKGTR